MNIMAFHTRTRKNKLNNIQTTITKKSKVAVNVVSKLDKKIEKGF